MSEQPFSPMVGDIISKMIVDGQDTTNKLIEGLTERAEVAEAELRAVRAEVMKLLSGRFMPMPALLEDALWPNSETVEEFREEKELE